MQHRDIKLENVLLQKETGTFKLCDFGSATKRAYTPGEDVSVGEAEEDIGKYTTLQYRAPEMVDLYMHRRVDHRADIWAMGCLMFKLMFFEDAFEESTLSILSGKIRIPESHGFSDDIIALLRSMLTSDPDMRCNIDDCVHQAFKLRSIPCPISTGMRRHSSASDHAPVAPSSTASAPPTFNAVFTSAAEPEPKATPKPSNPKTDDAAFAVPDPPKRRSRVPPPPPSSGVGSRPTHRRTGSNPFEERRAGAALSTP